MAPITSGPRRSKAWLAFGPTVTPPPISWNECAASYTVTLMFGCLIRPYARHTPAIPPPTMAMSVSWSAVEAII